MLLSVSADVRSRDGVIALEGQSNIRAPMSLGEYGDFVDEWAARWCVTEAGQLRWRHFAWEAFLLRVEQPDAFPLLSGDVPALHIRLADYVMEHGVRTASCRPAPPCTAVYRLVISPSLSCSAPSWPLYTCPSEITDCVATVYLRLCGQA